LLNKDSNKNMFVIGKVTATHGVRGQLRIVSYSGDFSTISKLKNIVLQGPDGEKESVKITSSAMHCKKLLVTLQGYNDINQVQHLVGREIYAERGQLPELAEGEYYWCDLIGLTVVTAGGIHLGELYDIMATGSNDVYLVRSGEKEYLIPAIEDVVVEVNLAAGVMTVSPLEGLLEL
jgi:16S rRNA processing protein RimM